MQAEAENGQEFEIDELRFQLLQFISLILNSDLNFKLALLACCVPQTMEQEQEILHIICWTSIRHPFPACLKLCWEPGKQRSDAFAFLPETAWASYFQLALTAPGDVWQLLFRSLAQKAVQLHTSRHQAGCTVQNHKLYTAYWNWCIIIFLLTLKGTSCLEIDRLWWSIFVLSGQSIDNKRGLEKR